MNHSGCASAGFAILSSAAVGLGVVLGVAVASEEKRPISAALMVVGMMSPFAYASAVFWALWLRGRRVSRRPTGMAHVVRTPTGWEARVSNLTRPFLSGAVLTGIIFVAALVPFLLWQRRNPTWFWAIVWPIALAAAAAVWPWRSRPGVVIDEYKRTLNFEGERGPVCVPWDAVVRLEVVRQEQDEGEDQHHCRLTYRGGGAESTVSLGDSTDPEAAARFADWLRGRLTQGRANGRG